MSNFGLRQYTKIIITCSLFALISLIFAIIAIVMYNTSKKGDIGTWHIFIACVVIFVIAYTIQLIYSIVVLVLNKKNNETIQPFFNFFNIFNMIPITNVISFIFGFIFLKNSKY